MGFGSLIRFTGYIFVAWSNYFNAYFSVLLIYLKSNKLVDSYCEVAGYAFKMKLTILLIYRIAGNFWKVKFSEAYHSQTLRK